MPPSPTLFPYTTLFRSPRSGDLYSFVLPRFSLQMSDLRHAFRNEKRSEEHTSELQSRLHLVCRLLLEKKKGVEVELRAAADLLNRKGGLQRRVVHLDAD